MTDAGTESPVVCLDLDGVLWRGDEVIAPAVEGMTALRASGMRVAFLSNNSSMPVGDVAAKLQRLGFAATPDEVLTSAIAAATLLAKKLAPGTRVLASAGPGVFEALAACGLEAVRETPAEAVVVGLPPRLRLRRSRSHRSRRARGRVLRRHQHGRHVSDTRRLVARHRIARGRGLGRVRCHPGGRGEARGADGRARARSARAHRCDGRATGRPPTARWPTALGWPFALVLSGVTAAIAPPGGEAIPDPPPAFVAADLGELAPRLIAAFG